MRLAALSGLDVAHVAIFETAGKDVLLIGRFDRIKAAAGWHRRAMVSALTILGLCEMEARYASYEDLAELICHRFTGPKEMLRELYRRICFNVLCGNTDDHARNHTAFWGGRMLTLTPAYDICPQGRAGNEATQAMLIKGEARMSTIAACLSAARDFHLSEDDAAAIIASQIETISENRAVLCDEAALSPVDAKLFAGRQFLNSYCVQGLGSREEAVRGCFEDARARTIGLSAERR